MGQVVVKSVSHCRGVSMTDRRGEGWLGKVWSEGCDARVVQVVSVCEWSEGWCR